MKYLHYDAAKLKNQFAEIDQIKKGSLLDYISTISWAYLCRMPANHWKSDLHLLPLQPAMNIPNKTKDKTFEQIADQRAKEIIKIAENSNRRCLVFWSGGIDSTCTLTALLRNGCNPVIAMNSQSVYENQDFYKRHIQNKLEIVFVHDVEYKEQSGFLFVRSSGGSSIMGGDNNAIYLYEHYDNARKNVSLELVKHLGKNIGNEYVERFFDDVMSSAKEIGVEIESLWDFVCFYDLIYKITYEYWLQDHHLFFRNNDSPYVIKNHNNWVQKFFVTEDFYRWAIYNATMEDRLGHKLTDHKWAFKQYILSFDKNTDYLYKLKTGSYGNWILLSDHRDYLGLNENYEFCKWKDVVDQLHQANGKIL
jgi:hypothetical protein